MGSQNVRIDTSLIEDLRKAYPYYRGSNRSLVEWALMTLIMINAKSPNLLIESLTERHEQLPSLPSPSSQEEVKEEETERDAPADDDEIDE